MPATFIVRGDDYLESERVNSLSGPAEKFFWRLMCAADTHGRMDARPAMLRIKLYGLQLDKIRESDMQRLLLECEQAGLVRSYEVGKKPYLQILRYGQRLRTKSKYPAPPGTTDLPQEDADLQQSAADLPLFAADTPQPAAIRRNLPQSAATCSNLQQTCSNPPHEYEYEKEYEKENINHNSISNPPTITPHRTTTLNRRTQQDCNANRRYDL